jgi:hypothetical protein
MRSGRIWCTGNLMSDFTHVGSKFLRNIDELYQTTRRHTAENGNASWTITGPTFVCC